MLEANLERFGSRLAALVAEMAIGADASDRELLAGDCEHLHRELAALPARERADGLRRYLVATVAIARLFADIERCKCQHCVRLLAQVEPHSGGKTS